MAPSTIGILHPGEMGVSLAAAARHGGHAVLWASSGRSAATAARAGEHGLVDAGSVDALCVRCDLIVSICPPHAAEEVATEVIARGYRGVFVDANAIAPARMHRMAAALTSAGIDAVDGGVIGGPAWTPGSTWLYLSGTRAPEVAATFAAAGLPLGFHAAAADLYRRLAPFRGASELPELEAVLVALVDRDGPGTADSAG